MFIPLLSLPFLCIHLYNWSCQCRVLSSEPFLSDAFCSSVFFTLPLKTSRLLSEFKIYSLNLKCRPYFLFSARLSATVEDIPLFPPFLSKHDIMIPFTVKKRFFILFYFLFLIYLFPLRWRNGTQKKALLSGPLGLLRFSSP